MLLAGLVSQKKERAVVGDPGTKLQHNSMYAGVAKIFSVHDLPEAKDQAIISTSSLIAIFSTRLSSSSIIGGIDIDAPLVLGLGLPSSHRERS